MNEFGHDKARNKRSAASDSQSAEIARISESQRKSADAVEEGLNRLDRVTHAAGSAAIPRGTLSPVSVALLEVLNASGVDTRSVAADRLARAASIDVGIVREDGHFGAAPGLAGDGFDNDCAVVNLGHFEVE